MADTEKNFAGRLLSQQSLYPGLQEKYRKELKEMLEVKIEGKRKLFSILVVGIMYLAGLMLLYQSIYNITSLDMFRYAFGILGLTLIARSVLGAMIIIKGVYLYQTHANISTALVVYGFTGTALILLGHGLDVQPFYMAAAGFVLLGAAAVSLIFNLIRQSKLNARERELMKEYGGTGTASDR